MTAAEADQRFDALVSQYRREHRREKGPAKTPAARKSTIGTLVAVIVFCLGVGCGAIWPGRPLTALLVGIPLVLIGCTVIRRRRGSGDD